MSDRVRVLLVDDHRIVRRGLARLLAAEGDIEVVGEAADGVEALELLAGSERHPDVVLVDVHMPRMDGTELVRRLGAEHPEVAAVVLTSLAEDEHLFACLRAGAKGYLLKDAEPEEMAQSIRRAARGESVFFGHAAERMLAALSTPPADFEPAAFEPADASGRVRDAFPDHSTDRNGLTEREMEVVRLIGGGATNREISRALHLSEGTVRNHVTNILRKLDLRDRTQLALWHAKRRDATGD